MDIIAGGGSSAAVATLLPTAALLASPANRLRAGWGSAMEKLKTLLEG